MRVLYLDESGNHDVGSIDPTYPVFAIGGAIVNRAYVRNVVGPQMRAFKLEHFGREDIVLHTVDMAKGRGDYGFLADPAKRAKFYGDLNGLLARWDYEVVVCVLEKRRFFEAYASPADLYHVGLEIIVERFCLELGSQRDAGYICAEKRNPGLDRELMQTWETLNSTGYANSRAIEERIVGLELRDKKPNYYGLQLADLVVTPVGRHVAARPPSPNQVQWSVVEPKLLRHQGTYNGAGLIIRPKRAS